jgi:hypothetical protein
LGDEEVSSDGTVGSIKNNQTPEWSFMASIVKK